MWRSKIRALDFVIRSSRRLVTTAFPHQVISRIPSPCFSVPISQNPRFFSNEPNPIDFDENPNFVSQDESAEIEIPSLISEQQDGLEIEIPSLISEQQDGLEIETPLKEEGIQGDGDEKMESLASSEEAEKLVGDEAVEIDREQIEKVLSLLQSTLDGFLESNLDKLNLELNEEFMVRVFETPLVPGESLIAFFKWASQKPDFSMNSWILGYLVRAVATGDKKKAAYYLWDLVKEIGEKEKGVLNTEILNQLISLFWKLGKGKAGLEVFDKFEEFGCEPNEDSYYLTIEALSKRFIFDSAWSVCEKMLNAGMLPESEKIGNIISCLCKGSKAKDAHLVYLMAKEKNKCLPRSPINFLINTLCKEDDSVKLALEMLEDFKGDALKYAIKPFSSVVNGLCRMKDVEEAKRLLQKMMVEGPPPGNAVFNSVISGLCKAGEMKDVMDLVKVMESRGLRPDVYTYTVIMSGYVKGGQMEDALKVLSIAKKMHSTLSPVTYHVLIRGYCKLEEFDKALELLNEMKESGIEPNADEYQKLIQSLCLKALDWRTAEKLLEEMKDKGLYLNGITQGLIRAVKEMEEQELDAVVEVVDAEVVTAEA